MSAIDPFDDIDLDLDPREPTDEELREDGDEDSWECCYPDLCCMPGEHMASECHTAADLIALEEQTQRIVAAEARENAVIRDLLS